MEDIFPQMQAQLNAGFSVGLSCQGISMQPMLYGGRDSVTLSPVSRALEKNDVILYRRRNGQFILHRIVGIGENAFICQGDNQYEKEYPVCPQQVIAVVTAFTRGGVYREITSKRYRVYCALWPYLRFIRRAWRKALRIITGGKKQSI